MSMLLSWKNTLTDSRGLGIHSGSGFRVQGFIDADSYCTESAQDSFSSYCWDPSWGACPLYCNRFSVRSVLNPKPENLKAPTPGPFRYSSKLTDLGFRSRGIGD